MLSNISELTCKIANLDLHPSSQYQEYPLHSLSGLPREIIDRIAKKLLFSSDVYQFSLASKSIYESIIPSNWPPQKKQAYFVKWIREPLTNNFYELRKYSSLIKGPFRVDAHDLAHAVVEKRKEISQLLHLECNKLMDMQDVRKAFDATFLNSHIQSITYKMNNDSEGHEIRQQTEDLHVDVIFHTERLRVYYKAIEHFKLITEIWAEDVASIIVSNLLLRPNLKKLKKLDISKVHIVNIDLNSVSPWMQLEELNLKKLTITSELLQQLLAKSPNIKKLSIISCKGTTDLDLISLDVLQYLEEIDVSASDLRSSDLKQLLAKAPNVKNLCIRGCRKINILFLDSLHVLQNLEIIIVADSILSSSGLNQLLAKAPHIKKIDMSNCSNLTHLDLRFLKKLQYLEEIQASDSKLTSEQLQQLLIKAPHIKSLNIGGGINITDLTLDSSIESLHYLEEIYASRSALTSQGLVQLLTKAPHIKRLYISGCRNIERFELPSIQALQFLEVVVVSGSQITSSSLSCLLEKSPYVKELEIISCRNIRVLNLAYLERLKWLERIYLNSSHHTLEEQQQLRAKYPNIKKLCISKGDPDLASFEMMQMLENFYSPLV